LKKPDEAEAISSAKTADFNMDFLYDPCGFGISSYREALNLLFSDLKMIILTDFLLPKLHLGRRLKFSPAKGSGSF